VRVALASFLGLHNRPDLEAMYDLQPFTKDKDSTFLRILCHDESGNDLESWLYEDKINWITLFEHLPTLKDNVPLSLLLELIPPQHARHYSISSDLSVNPCKFDLCVSVLRFEVAETAGSTLTTGVCSGFIEDLKLDDEVCFSFHAVPDFHLPISPIAPIICVSTGSGFAPMRGFVQQRMARLKETKTLGRTLGPMILIHGCRDESEILFKQDVDEAIELGAVTDVFYGFSRSKRHYKEYVQDVILKDDVKDVIASLLEDDQCNVYICGNATMAIDVTSSFERILSMEKIADMRRLGKFHEEVFGELGTAVNNSNKSKTSSKTLITAKESLKKKSWMGSLFGCNM
jgi:cytochrome P450/NADPH-cytochrome P450 reductase